MTQTSPDTPSGDTVADAEALHFIQAALSALARAAISYGITHQTFASMSKHAFFDEARQYAPLKGKPNSDSRIAVLTGLSRRDVRQLREAGPPEPPKPSLNWRISQQWSSLPQFLDENGKRKPLPRTRHAGGEVSWDALVESLSQEVRPRTVLDEWLRLQLAVLDDQDRVVSTDENSHLKRRGDETLTLRIAAQMVNEALRIAQRSPQVSYQQPVRGLLSCDYGHRMTHTSAQQVYLAATHQIMPILDDLNRMIVEFETLDAGKADANYRVFLGVIYRYLEMGNEPMLMLDDSQPA